MLKKIYIIVKAYPEKSQKYGSSICTAGITEDGQWIRIYPIDFNYYISHEGLLKKWNFISAEVQDVSEKLMRKESHKVREKTIKLIDDSLTKIRLKETWAKRNNIILPHLCTSVEELEVKKQNDNTSLGIIKPKQFSFYLRKPINEIKIEKSNFIQKTLDGKELIEPDKIEKDFAFRFQCNDPNCHGHDMICEEWEVVEAFRSWKLHYNTDEELRQALINKFDTEMKEKRDLYFILGTTAQYGTWVIIGLYFPPRQAIIKSGPLTRFFKPIN